MIYLDHNATSPLRPEARHALLAWIDGPANPSSAHAAGRAAEAALQRAREQVAALVGADPEGVVFTSGATEANHMVLLGLAHRAGRVMIGAVEHPSVHAAAERLRAAGRPVEILGVGRDGVVRPDVDASDGVISLMAAQHETGVIMPVDDVVPACRRQGSFMHVDATQAAGRIPLVRGADALVLSAHKLGGPPGIGAVIFRERTFPALFAGSQQRGRRGGTTPVALAAGFGAAAAVVRERWKEEAAAWLTWRGQIEESVQEAGGRIVGGAVPRLPNTVCVVFPGVRGDAVVQALDLDGLCTSAGAACASGSLRPSPTLAAMGDPEPAGAVRVSLGWSTVAADIDGFRQSIGVVVARCRRAGAVVEGWS